MLYKEKKQYWESEGIRESRAKRLHFDFIHIHKHNQHHTQIKNGGFIKNYKFEGIQENFWGNLGQNGLKTHNFEAFKNKLWDYQSYKN